MEVRSTIDDPVLLERIAALSHGTPDPTGNWIGGGRPHTNVDVPVGPLKTSSKAFARWSATHYAFYAELIGMDPQILDESMSMDVIDLGCAGGSHALQLAGSYRGLIFGIDRDADCIAFARQHNHDQGVSYECMSWPHRLPRRVDRIFAVEFFEHFRPGDQVAAIQAAVDALTDDGMLFLTMPNEPPGQPPHEGTRLTESFCALMHEAGIGCMLNVGTFDNAAPGDQTDLGWRPIGPRASHNYAVIRR